jgi:hypothetical protein
MCENGSQHRFQAGSMSFFKSQAPKITNTNITHSQNGRGWNAFLQYSEVSWLKLKLQTVGFFFGVGPGKFSLHLSKHGLDAIAGPAAAEDAGYVGYW